MTELSRRSFVAWSGCFALSSMIPREVECAPLDLPVGIQLWAVRTQLEADPLSTLKALRRIGYRQVEAYSFPGNLPAKALRQHLDEADLRCPSAHLDFMNGSGSVESLFDSAHALGAHYVVSSVLQPGTGAPPEAGTWPKQVLDAMRAMTLDDAHKAAAFANRIGEQARKAGLRYAYHNHFQEFVDQGDGAVAYDILLQQTDPELVSFELDCGWMRVAGRDPLQYMQKYPGRFSLLHVKDFATVGGRVVSPTLREGTELGRGFIDYRPIFAAAMAGGMKHYFVEQEGPFRELAPLEAAKVSYAYLQALG